MLHHVIAAPRSAASAAFAARDFTPLDQDRFIAWSGDRNPIHLASHADGAIVHGIHTALWGLDGLFEAVPDLEEPASVRVRFEKLVHVGDRVAPVLVQREPRKLRLNLMRGEERVASLHIGLEPMPAAEPLAAAETIPAGRAPRRPSFAEMAVFGGRVPITGGQRILAGLFPHAVRGLGRSRVAGLVCSSVVVGMICPGLQSLYAGFDLATTGAGEDEALTVVARDSDARFRRLILSVAGCGWTGRLDTLSPLRPAEGRH